MSENVDLRVKRSQMYLKDAMTTLLEEKPLDAITVQEVANRAMVNRSTFYAHYQDKDDLFHAVVEDDLRAQLDARLQASQAIGPENLQALAEVVFDHFQTHGRTCHAGITPRLLSVQAIVIDVLMEWATPDGACHSHGVGRMIATTVSWAIVGAAADWSRNRHTNGQTAEQAVAILMPVVLNGVIGLRAG